MTAQNRKYLTTLANLGIASHRLDQIRDAARLHRQQLIGISELYAVIEELDPVSSAVRVPDTGQTALRDAIAEALMRWAERNNDPQYAPMRRSETVRENAYSRADAVLAVLPAPVEDHRLALSMALGLGTTAPWDAIHDRATELGLPPLDQDPVARMLGLLPAPADQAAEWRAAARFVEAMNEGCGRAGCESCTTRVDVAAELRRVADEQTSAVDRAAVLREAADIADEVVPPDLPRDDRDQGRADAAADIRRWADHVEQEERRLAAAAGQVADDTQPETPDRAAVYREVAERLVAKYGVTNRAAAQIRQWAAEEPSADRPAVGGAQQPKPFTPPAHYRRDDGVDCCVHTIPVGPDSCRACRELADDEQPKETRP